MKTSDLPHGESKKALNFPHFPTRCQAVVWRNWGLVPVERIARVLKTSAECVRTLGADMGLRYDDSRCPVWLERGFLSIIRRNWHLLPYEQLLELLEWTPEQMAFVLKEDDFFWVKLGRLKPEAEPVHYAPLTEEEARRTGILRRRLAEYFPEDGREPIDPPFAFLDRYGKQHPTAANSGRELRLAYAYSAVYGDPLLNEKLDPYPDGLLAEYAASGVNAVWLQGTLYTLVPWFGESSYSEGWRTRLENLGKLCRRAARHGIRIYLYLNEPRSMPPEFFNDRPSWRGADAKDGLSATFCTSQKEVADALRDGVSELFRRVPELGGILTITMSENLTNCCSRPQDLVAPCPVCSARGAAEVVAGVNRVIAEGVHRVKPEADVIAWTWGWFPEWDERAVELLPKDVRLMCVSETAVVTDAQGIKGEVLDYSISKVGPGPVARRLWRKAQECGLETVAKVQLNNTWELSAVPYIPVPGLVERHLENLRRAGVNDLMLSWTLGGYPGGNFDLLVMTKDELALEHFGASAAPSVLEAWGHFDRAFEYFPLHMVSQLYMGPQNSGPADLLFAVPTGYKATMTGFPYDDLEAWCGNHYPADIFEDQFRKLSEGWGEGMKRLEKARGLIGPENAMAFEELWNVAEAAYCHFRSTYLQIAFVRRRADGDVLPILREEIELARRLYRVTRCDSRIGFEASNHYYYTANDLKEKVLNCLYLAEQL